MRTAALLFAIATTSCTTPSKFWRPTAYHYEQIHKEYVRLSGTYGYGGSLHPMGGGGLNLYADGKFAFIHSSCIGRLRETIGNWYPCNDRIKFEPVFLSTSWLEHRGGHSYKTDTQSTPIKKGDWSSIPWGSSGMQMVNKGNIVELYPLDTTLRIEVTRKATLWPLRKYSGTKW